MTDLVMTTSSVANRQQTTTQLDTLCDTKQESNLILEIQVVKVSRRHSLDMNILTYNA